MSIKYIKGDLFKALKQKTTVIVPHVTNIFGAMGAGFAAQVREKYPNTDDYYRYCCKTWDMKSSYSPLTFFSPEDFGWFANMTCQTSLGEDKNATYSDLIKCMEKVYEHIQIQIQDGPSVWEIYSPKFGAGLCGLNWEFVSELIEEVWVDKGIDVTVFHL